LNTRNKNRRIKEKRRSMQLPSSKGAFISERVENHFDGVLHYFFTYTVNRQYRELPTKEVKIKRRYWKSDSVARV